MLEYFEDERGLIQDILGATDGVTWITTKAGAVRGNHVHKLTEQWTFIAIGKLLVANGEELGEVGPGKLIYHPPGVPHAWKALTDSGCLVFAKGPRVGKDYESDTYRLKEPLIS